MTLAFVRQDDRGSSHEARDAEPCPCASRLCGSLRLALSCRFARWQSTCGKALPRPSAGAGLSESRSPSSWPRRSVAFGGSQTIHPHVTCVCLLLFPCRLASLREASSPLMSSCASTAGTARTGSRPSAPACACTHRWIPMDCNVLWIGRLCIQCTPRR